MTSITLVAILALTTAAFDVQAKTHLRPFAARHAAANHAKKPAAPIAPPAHKPEHKEVSLKARRALQPPSNSVDVDELAETAARQAENEAKTVAEEPKKSSAFQPPSNSVDIDDITESVEHEAETNIKVPTPTSAPAVQPTAVLQLNKDLAEVKQMRTNVAVVEKALAADVTLLRETANLQKMASTPESRQAAKVQLHEAEQLVKATEAMVKKSRGDAEDRARAALHEATEVQNAVDALIKEAKTMVKKSKAAAEAAPTKEVDDSSDDASM